MEMDYHRFAAMEADTAVLKAIMPRIEEKIDRHIEETKVSREATNSKLDKLMADISARENQAIGGLFVGRKMAAMLLAMAAAAGAAGGKVGAFLAKLL